MVPPEADPALSVLPVLAVPAILPGVAAPATAPVFDVH
jgi:hypothetical protein